MARPRSTRVKVVRFASPPVTRCGPGVRQAPALSAFFSIYSMANSQQTSSATSQDKFIGLYEAGEITPTGCYIVGNYRRMYDAVNAAKGNARVVPYLFGKYKRGWIAKKPLTSKFGEWKEEADKYAWATYCIDAVEIAGDAVRLREEYELGSTPEECVDFYADKYDLEKVQ